VVPPSLRKSVFLGGGNLFLPTVQRPPPRDSKKIFYFSRHYFSLKLIIAIFFLEINYCNTSVPTKQKLQFIAIIIVILGASFLNQSFTNFYAKK